MSETRRVGVIDIGTVTARVGMADIQTCAAGASELLGKGEAF